MVRVSEIRIDPALCIGCGRCVNACFTDVLYMDPSTKKPTAKYLNECEFCLVCEQQCPKNAIYVKPAVPFPVYTTF